MKAGFLGGSVVKNLPANTGDMSWIAELARSPEKEMAVFLPRESHTQRRLIGFNLWSHERVGHNLVTK